jgi:hypothetical protein
LDLGLSERHHRKLEGDTTGLPNASLHVLDQIVEVLIARCELGGRVADSDHWSAGENVVR